MAFCKACGQDAGDASFCPKCGAAQGASPAGALSGAIASSGAVAAASGIEENVAGLLCYVFGWVSGLIFLLVDKRSFVRFHGAQSIALSIAFFIVWAAFWIVTMILGVFTALLHFPIGFLMVFLFPVVLLGFFIIFVYCMYKAYQHEKFKFPVIGNIVEKMLGQ
jgi:uncharacterized membrane protein